MFLRPRLASRPLRWLVYACASLILIVFGLSAVALVVAWRPMGHSPDPEGAARMEASPNSADGVFINTQPLWNDYWGVMFGGGMSDYAEANAPLPVRTDTAERLREPPGPLRLTWLGHSTTLIELAGNRVLTDPVFGPSPFPITAIGPQRWYEPPLPLESLRGVDLVLISHDHYDHLDSPTIERMVDWDTTFITALGVGAHLEYWGIDPKRIVELDWWQEYQRDELRVVSTPARHASGRQLFDQGRTQWAGYALIGPESRVMFSGDTGLFDDMSVIGEKYGPFDIVMIEVGAYHRAWPDWHIGPEQAIRAHKMMKGGLFVPIHWGLFNLAMHGWTEPMERVWVAAHAAQVPFATPRPGEVIDPANPAAPERWWPELPWETAQEHPIVSTKNGDPNVRYEPSGQ